MEDWSRRKGRTWPRARSKGHRFGCSSQDSGSMRTAVPLHPPAGDSHLGLRISTFSQVLLNPLTWQKPRITHAVWEVRPYRPRHHHLSPVCLWIHGGLDVRALDQLQVQAASLWFSLQKRVPQAQGLVINLSATARVLWNSELWAQESFKDCLEYDHMVGCELGTEPPA